MTACVLSPQNVREIKAMLRSRHPSVCSAHATEAIARAFGYNTNAALIAAFNSFPSGVTMIGQFDRSACKNRLRELTSDDALELEDLDERAFAKFAAWKLFPSRDKSSPAYNQWHRECTMRGLPCISINTRTKLAQVKWDLITIPYEIETAIRRQKGDEVVRALYEVFCRISTSTGPHRKAIFEGSTFYGYVDNVPIATAVRIANGFCVLLHREILARCRADAGELPDAHA